MLYFAASGAVELKRIYSETLRAVVMLQTKLSSVESGRAMLQKPEAAYLDPGRSNKPNRRRVLETTAKGNVEA